MNRRDAVVFGSAALGAGYLPVAGERPAGDMLRGTPATGVGRLDGLAAGAASMDADLVSAWPASDGFRIDRTSEADGREIPADDCSLIRFAREIAEPACVAP